jgi:hypothetical protein
MKLMKIDDGICSSKLDHLNMMVTEGFSLTHEHKESRQIPTFGRKFPSAILTSVL